MQAISTMTSDDLLSENVLAELMKINDAFERKTTEAKLSAHAKKLHITKEFNSVLTAYKHKVAAMRNMSRGNVTNFIDQPLQLYCGDWICDISGVRKNTVKISNGEIEVKYASPIPVLVTEILVNYDEGIEKMRIAFYKDGLWQSLVCERATAASASSIVQLSNKGLEVNSENAKLLVKYIGDLVALNLDKIPKRRAVSKLGWCGDEFLPYSDVVFDGAEDCKHIFESLTTKGDYSAWVSYTHELRKNKLLRLQMAASFAAPLLEKLNVSPFILHLWGKTGSGKTVGLMVAMSIWGDPALGKLTHTMNMTDNALMSMSDFLNNIPFAGDELQTIKSAMGYDTLIMRCTEKVGRARMKYDKLQRPASWNTAYLFTGEEPCTRESSGGGTKNRVIEIECGERNPVVENGNEVVCFVSENYGFASRVFIAALNCYDLHAEYGDIFREIMETCETLEKQAMAMSCILLADRIACDCIYLDEKPLEIKDVKMYLRSKKEVDTSERAYDYVKDVISSNVNRFSSDTNGEIWGKIDGDFVYINKTTLVKLMRESNFEFDAVKSAWSDKGYLIKNSQGRLLHHTKCFGVKSNYIKIKITSNENEQIEIEEPPF